jgi:hypothetical protein
VPEAATCVWMRITGDEIRHTVVLFLTFFYSVDPTDKI